MTRSYTLDNWDGHLSKFESHKLPQALRQAFSPPLDDSSFPASATSDLQRPVIFSPNSKTTVVDASPGYAPAKFYHSVDDASNEPPHNSISHPFEKIRLFDSSDLSDTDLTSDIATDALNPPSPATRDNEPRSPSIARNGTRCSPFSVSPPKPETLVPSPALTVQTISTYTADAHGEEEDDDVIIVDHVQSSFSSRDKRFDEAPTIAQNDSLFTPPPSETTDRPSTSELPPPRTTSSPAPRKIRIMASHVLVPLLPKPKSEYISLSSFPARKRPHRTAQDRLKDVLNAVLENNESLGWLGEHEDDEDVVRRKKRKRKHKPQEGGTRPVAESLKRSHDDEESVVFVNRTPIVKHLAEEKAHQAETTFIDLTLDDDEEAKPPSVPTQSVTLVMKETGQQPPSEETRISVGIVRSISCETLLRNTRFLRHLEEDTDPHKDFVMLDSLLPFRRRRALLDNNLEGSTFLADEFSLGFPVLTEFGLDMFGEHYSDDDDSVYDMIELLDESVVSKPVVGPGTLHPPPTLVNEPLVCPPKIDLAAKYRKKKTAASRRTSVLTPARRDAPVQPSRSPVSPLRNRPVQDMMIDHDGYNAHTPLVPSAKALGKRKAVESPLQALRPRPDLQSFPSSRTAAADNSFDSYINYWPTSPGHPISDTPSLNLGTGDTYSDPDPYSNPSSIPNFNFFDPRHQYPSPSAEPQPSAASLFYHSDNYNGTSDDLGHFAGSVLGDPPPPSELTFLPSWSPGLDAGFHYDNGTVNPSLLGGEPLVMSEQPESYLPDVGSELFNPEKETESCPSNAPSPMTLTSSPKSENVQVRRDTDSGTIFVRHTKPTTSFVGGDSPNHSKRRHVRRSMPDMVPSAILSLSSSSSSSSDYEEETDGVSKRQSTKPPGGGVPLLNHVKSRTKSGPTVALKAAAILAAGLNLSGPKVMMGGQSWPMQEEAAYCHQCRNKTMVLKLKCERCNRHFCIRCLTLRYPDEPRALQMKETGCPLCLEYCNCTICCKKRGVEYISTKNALAGGVTSRAQLTAKKKANHTSSGVSSLSPVPEFGVAPPPRPSSPSLSSRAPLTPTEGVYWGVIYGADGSKIGKGFSFAKEDVRERCAPDVPKKGVYWGAVYGADGSKIGQGYTVAKQDVGKITGSVTLTKQRVGTNVPPRRTKKRRVYVGMIHPSWQFDGTVKKSVLDPVPPPKRVHESRRPRKYVGNKAVLFYKSERMARELADLSPLSSLEEDWNEEDRRVVEEDDWDMVRSVGNAGNARKTSNDGSSRSLSDQDVMRAIGLGLHACGIQLEG